jgi:hypothetical protein
VARDTIRQMKKTLRAGMATQASEALREEAVRAALALLERGVRMHHSRLAVQRLNEAVAIGADVPQAYWRYCLEAATASRDTRVQALFASSAQAAHAKGVHCALPNKPRVGDLQRGAAAHIRVP